MKNQWRKFVLAGIFVIGSTMLHSQPPPPPGEHGGDGNTNAGNAPIGGGLVILLTMGAAYGGRKLYQTFKNQDSPEE